MPFRIKSFRALELPAFVQRGNTQDMGSARAAVDMVQLPGGAYYDNYGDYDSPREIAPITKDTEIHAGDQSVREQVEAWRALVGKVGAVIVEWHDGEEREVYARFTEFRYPRDYATALSWIPASFTFTPRSPVWRATTTTETTETFDFSTSEDLVVHNPGTATVTEVYLRYEYNPLVAGAVVLDLLIENRETSQRLTATVGLDDGWALEVNTDRKTVYTLEPAQSLAVASRSANTIALETGSAHGLSAGDLIRVSDTLDYDGVYEVISVPNTLVVEVEADPFLRSPYGPLLATGYLERIQEAYANVEFSDPGGWFTLAPGDNDIHLESDQSMQDCVFTCSFYPIYG